MEMIHDELSGKIIESARKLTGEKKTGKLTVRDILKDLQITNRVFYNRFHNIDEVLDLLYAETIQRVRESLSVPWPEDIDFFEHVKNVASRTLVLTYESRRNISQFVFETDSLSDQNFEWWNQEIKKLIEQGKELGYIKEELKEEYVSYSIWCFIRGFNADAMMRNLPESNALEQFQYGLDILLNGIRA